MKRIKKYVVSLLLVPCMVFSMCVPVAAAPNNSSSQDTVVNQKTNNGKKVGQSKNDSTTDTPVEEPVDPTAPTVKFTNTFVEEGVALTIETTNYPEGSELTYKWTSSNITNRIISKDESEDETKIISPEVDLNESTSSYTPKAEDCEKWIKVTVSCEGYEDQTAQIYFSKLPVIYLDFNLREVIDTKVNYVDAKIKMQGNDKFNEFTNAEDPVLYNKDLKVKGRGNTSWHEDKKPFKLKLDKKANMLNMGKNKHWVLLADATEDSLLRNDLSYKLSGEFGLTYQDGEWVDLIINGEYYGNYYLCEHVRIGSTRVDIEDVADATENIAENAYNNGIITDEDGLASELEENLSWINKDTYTFADPEKGKVTFKPSEYYTDKDKEGNLKDIKAFNTGGVLFELDAYYDEVSKFKSSLNQPIMFNSPEFANTNNMLMAYSKNFINSFEKAIQKPNFHATYNGKNTSAYDLFDFDALIRYWLVEEIFMNEDAMKKSTYFHKDQDKNGVISKMQMGPVWDMDWSSNGIGDVDDYAEWQTIKYNDKVQKNQWYKYIVQDPYFLTRAQEFYWEHHGAIKDMIDSIYKDVDTKIFHDSSYDYLLESAKANNTLWGNYKHDFVDEVSLLHSWLNNRIAWLDGKMSNIEDTGLYTPNKDIKLTYVDNELKVNAPGVKADILLNGELLETITLKNNQGKFNISSEKLTNKRDVIYVVVYDAVRKVVGTNYCYDQELTKGNFLKYEMVKMPDKQVYSLNEKLNLSGMQVIAIYDNGYKEIIPNIDLNIAEFDSSTIGKKTVKLTYGKWSDSFDVLVSKEISDWKNGYVTIGSDLQTGNKPLNVEVWESGAGNLYTSGQIVYDGDFSQINFSALAAEGWIVKLAKYRYNDSKGKEQESSPVYVNSKNGMFNFNGFNNASDAHTLIIDIVRSEEKETLEVPLDESFTATDCGKITTEAKGTANKVGFIVNKGNAHSFVSQKSFTYDGDFNKLTFNYIAPEGYDVANIEVATSENEKIKVAYENSVISFNNITADTDVEYIIVNLKEKASGEFTLTCDRPTVRINTNAIVYLTIKKEITAADIKISENGNEITTFKEPVYDEAKGAWKLYIKPTTLGLHTYTITVGDYSQDIIIQGSRTAL